MSIQKQQPDTLYVRMLGGFSMNWNGKLVGGGSKASDSQFSALLQILIHNGADGVTRDRLEELLFGDREIDNVHHALQSVIYNAKKKLEKAGLPKVNYILAKKGVFYWTEEVPTVEDAAEFRKAAEAAREETDPQKRLRKFLDACYLYSGEFLPMQTGVLWVVREAMQYEALFCECVEEALKLLREFQDYIEMRELGEYASSICPLSDWEAVTMEALVSLRQYEDAYKFYEKTVAYYLNEQGLRPSKKLMEQLGRLGEEMKFEHSALEEIQTSLLGSDDEEPGGYLCNYPVFQGIYRMVKRMLERGGQSVFLMLCTIVDGKGNPMRDGPMLEELSQRLQDAARESVRRGDALCQYGTGQCLLLLVNTTRENCSIVQKRINQRFIIGRQRSGVQYFINSVFWIP